MAGELVLCEGCKRHVFAKETACPFCHASMGAGGRGLAAAVALSAGLSLVGCTREQADVYGSPPPSATPPQVAVYGAPPPRMTAPAAPPDVPSTSATPPASAKPDASAKPTTTSAKPRAQPVPTAIPAYGLPPPRKPSPGSEGF